jgi:hypothetical protein
LANAGFVGQTSYAVGVSPESLAVADLNGDGILDLAVADRGTYANNFTDSSVSILLGNGDGTFQPAVNYQAGSEPVCLAVADFNGDGIPDLAVGNEHDTTVSILLGNGDGTFQAARSYATGYFPQSLAVGDFNGDGVLDLALVGNSVSILLGNGDGSFQLFQSSAGSIDGSPVSGFSVAVGDFNGDGVLDLTVATASANTQGGILAIFLGNGDGSFRATQATIPGSDTASVAVGDFNGDGIPDLAVAGSTPTSGTLSVLLGKGDGTFQTPRTYSVAGDTLAIGDFNGDGHLDIALAGNSGVNILLGNGDGTFQIGQSYAPWASAVAMGDFNKDGHLDLAVANFSTGSVYILPGNGDGTFQGVQSYVGTAVPPYTLASVVVANFNGDGHLDLVGNDGSVLLGKGDGTFQAAPGTGGLGSFVATGDFNRDGILDLAVATDEGVTILLGNGDGSFRYGGHIYTGSAPNCLAVADFNGDGKLDLAMTIFVFTSSDPRFGGTLIESDVRIFLGQGDGSFQPGNTYNVSDGNPVSVAVGDFNGDGIPDLALAAGGNGYFPSSTVGVLLGNGDGNFQDAASYSVGSNSRHPSAVAVGDFNGDGVPDLVVANSSDGTVSILLGNGDGTFGSATSYGTESNGTNPNGSNPRAVAVGDFNGDGIADLAVTNAVGVSILLGAGQGTFHAPVNYATAGPGGSVVVADFNGDGFPDLAVTAGGGVTVLLNDTAWGR